MMRSPLDIRKQMAQILKALGVIGDSGSGRIQIEYNDGGINHVKREEVIA